MDPERPAITRDSTSVAETEATAIEFSHRVGNRDWVGLIGPLGAGKSVFARALAHSLGVTGAMPSPTYTILNVHQGRVPVYHADCYRVDSPDELEFAGVTQYFNRTGVCLIEWAEKVRSLWPESGWIVTISIIGPQDRQIEIVPLEDYEL